MTHRKVTKIDTENYLKKKKKKKQSIQEINTGVCLMKTDKN